MVEVIGHRGAPMFIRVHKGEVVGGLL